MRVLTVPEFYDWTKRERPAAFLFSTENNNWIKPSGIKIMQSFQSVALSASLNRLCFRNSTGFLCMEQIKEVHMYDDREDIGVVFDVVCDPDFGGRVWRLIAD